MTDTSIIPSIEQERSLYTLQPAIVIGLGDLGWSVCKEWELRQNIYRQFHSPLITATIDAPFCLLPEKEESVEWENAPVEHHRQKLRERVFLTDFVQRIARAYHEVRAHAKLPLADRVRPTIFIIGATWSPVGRALLWPLAYLIRSQLGNDGSYELIGIFVAAQWDYTGASDKVLRCDALTYELLCEGDNLQQGSAWRHDLAAALGHDFAPKREQEWFDRIFLLDNVKQNNTTSPAYISNPAEIVQLVGDLLEACIQSELLSLIDRCCSSDRSTRQATSDTSQRYIGVGISSLAVPLAELHELLLNYTVAHLLRTYVLAPSEPPKITAQAAKDVRRNLQEYIIAAAKTALADNRPDAVQEQGDASQAILTLEKTYTVGQSGQNGVITTKLVTKPDIATMFVGVPQVSLRIRWTNPLSEHEPLRTTNNRIKEEKEQLDRLIRELRRTGRNTLDKYLDATRQIVGQAIKEQLKTGDQGLTRALAVAEDIQSHLKRAITEAQKEWHKRQTALDRRNRRWRSVQGADPRSQLENVVPLVPRVPALLLRVILIGIVLWQFYSDGLRNGIVFWPLDFWITPTNGSALASQGAALSILVLILGLLAFVSLLPWFVARLYLASFRRHLIVETQIRLQQELIILQQSVLEGLHWKLTEYLETKLKLLRENLAAQREQLDSYVPDETYQVYPVVDPVKLAQTFREDLLAATKQPAQRLVSSWLANDADPNKEWPEVHQAQTIVEQMKDKLKTMVPSGQYVRPINAHLVDQDLEEWAIRIGKASVPWVKVAQPTVRSADDNQQALPVEMMCLIAPEGRANPIALHLAKTLGFCEIASWADQYRIMLVRVIGNFTASQLARWPELESRKKLVDAQQAAAQQPTTTQADADGAGLSAASQTPVSAAQPTASQELNAMTIPSTYAELLERLNKLLDEERNAIESDRDRQAEIDLKGVEEAIHDLQRKIGGDQPEPTRVARELKTLNYLADYPTMAERVRQLLSRMYNFIDGWLQREGIIPMLPERGERYDPAIHGTATDREPDPGLPDGVIKMRIRRGYMQAANKEVLVEPVVVVVHNER